MKKLIVSLFVISIAHFARASYLYWQVDAGNTSVDSSTFNAARISVVGVSGSYLADYYDSTATVFNAPGSGSVSLTFNDTNYGVEGFSYFIELGNYNNSDFDTKYVYTVSYSEAASKGWIDTSSMDIQRATQNWSGVAYAVPEPTGAMLLVIGMAMLGLKRKKV